MKVSSQFIFSPNAEFLAGENWKYQQDNAPIHSNNSTKNWFQVNNEETLKSPAKFPDLNPIENLWRDIAKRVYANEGYFTSSIELKSTIEDEWHKTEPRTLSKTCFIHENKNM
ncbi:hypothetical protein AVEN_199714-1 [Araneus ventricosus]|uniref:Tc1-like transposase DDE domain-containing protein n=1 Tax=Araneus ventricosus TaxID=182803 RepID=A0A4Y2L2T4_ARAVE|nr:hypothetical protein AVEN_199714-1 [Araneus ventricosus]